MATKTQGEDVIVIGIDFGTTFSGVSWAWSGEPMGIEIISKWESKLGRNSDKEKTPTMMIYSGKRGEVSWGYGLAPDGKQEPLKWFKLLLVDDGDLPISIRESSQIAAARRLVKDANKDPVEVIGCYLRHLWNHAIECIAKSGGTDLVTMCKFHVVITLPAIWPEYAKQRMQRAVENAGMLKERPAGTTTLSFITEPEAAALAMMRDQGRRPNIQACASRGCLSVGDHIVVCDAGGGTVDLISYEIISKEPFSVREAVQGDGDLCGGVFLDESFIDKLKEKVTPEAWNNVPEAEARKVLNNDWENNIKTSFVGEDEDFYFGLPAECRAPGSSQRGVKRKKNLVFDVYDMKAIFDPIVGRTVALVKKQIDNVIRKAGKHPKKVILVGGFGRSDYLRICLQEEIGDATEVLQGSGNRPWSAISRGAVIQGLTQRNLAPGLSVKIESRISRMSYGVDYTTQYDPNIHGNENKYWCKKHQVWKVDDQMSWFLQKGTDISTAKPVVNEYFRLFDSPPEKIEETIYSTGSWPVPTALNETVKELCTISWTKEIDIYSLPRWTNPLGKVFSKLEFSIEMTCSGGTVDFSVIHDGKQVGTKNVQVVFKEEDDF
ncbi:Heat shock 70 kDa protein 12A [Colletotrichum siamense]|nr:Heat shock 70 kDa protein 12A [Colletotrichum siamense]